MRPRLNLLKTNISKNVNESVEVSELDYWKYYLSITSIHNSKLSPSEIEVLAFILSRDPDKSYLQGSGPAQIMRKFGFKKQQVWNYKQSFLKKGYVVKEGKNYKIESNLKSLQRFIKKLKESKQELEIILPFKITET